eukprot:11825726-Alexandrium_andersonii.AAC.1
MAMPGGRRKAGNWAPPMLARRAQSETQLAQLWRAEVSSLRPHACEGARRVVMICCGARLPKHLCDPPSFRGRARPEAIGLGEQDHYDKIPKGVVRRPQSSAKMTATRKFRSERQSR